MGLAMKTTFLGGAFLLAVIVTPTSSHAQETITIEGQLENGTADAEVPQGMIVTANVFRLGENLDTRETVADAEGRFSFHGVPGGQGYGYIISTKYAGAVYFFEGDYPLDPGLVQLAVYENTSSSSAIKVRSHTLVVNAADSASRLMNSLELVGLDNTGDRTFIPDLAQAGQMDMLRFSLPSTVTNLDVQSSLRGGQILQVELGFAMTSPVPPGTHEIGYTYLSSYKRGNLTFAHALPFGADTFLVLLVQGLGQAKGTGLEEMGHLVLGEGDNQRDYQRLEAHNLSAGARVVLDFTGLPEPSLWKRWQATILGEGFLKMAVPSAFGMALVALLAYVIFRKKEPSVATYGNPVHHTAMTEAIAHLDDRFQQRELGKQEYLHRRRELKGQILGWMAPLPSPETQPTPKQVETPPGPSTEQSGRPESSE
ncbi:hypothetical protein FIM08_03295 [SAR202 cluster bacterium AC-647-N09_OGT_505m]|nr:hypothetical protein [SAR202 cluster bacterium AC-647-N09_OGT_505m]